LDLLLALSFIDPNDKLFIKHLDLTCDTAKKEIANLDEAALDRIHRFLRLQKKTGWKLEVLNETHIGLKEEYQEKVQKCIDEIQLKKFNKVVLSRRKKEFYKINSLETLKVMNIVLNKPSFFVQANRDGLRSYAQTSEVTWVRKFIPGVEPASAMSNPTTIPNTINHNTGCCN
jgi:isochorismate synthase EntC